MYKGVKNKKIQQRKDRVKSNKENENDDVNSSFKEKFYD